MNSKGQAILKKGKETSIRRLHPWIFSGAINTIQGTVKDGDWIEVTDFKGTTLGFGHYQQGSIAIRILSFEPKGPSADFWIEKFSQALQLRKHILLPSPHTDAFRLIHGEGDGLPGLVIDVYNGTAVIQAHSTGMHHDRELIKTALQEVLKDSLKAIYYKSQGTLPGITKTTIQDEYLWGSAVVPHLIHENNNSFHIDWETGQKTGFFLDQRENRKLLGKFSKNKKVLNTFCYTGGFSIYALQGGAQLVHSVDASQKAIELTRTNLELNGFDATKHSCFTEDTFEFLENKKDVYDLIVLDPPAFAKHRDARHQAVKGYQRLNMEAMKAIRSQGIIFTFSCSQVVDRQLFYDTVVSASIQAGRNIKVLHHLTQPADHPVSIFHPEGEYLKGLVLYVE